MSSGDCFLPSFAAAILARVSAEYVRVFARVDSFCLVSSDRVTPVAFWLPVNAADSFCRVLTERLTPRAEPAVGQVLYAGRNKSIHCCSQGINLSRLSTNCMTSNEKALTPYLAAARNSGWQWCVPLRNSCLCLTQRFAMFTDEPMYILSLARLKIAYTPAWLNTVTRCGGHGQPPYGGEGARSKR